MHPYSCPLFPDRPFNGENKVIPRPVPDQEVRL
jgi:hypothetical protein